MGRRKGTTAFPIARIKKIMQSDDDVGKIATNTPALVGKALECLMEDLLRDSANVALERRAKTLTPSHLKASIGNRAQFDFLRPLLATVPDISETVESNNESKPKRPRSSAVPSLNTDAPIVLKRRKPAASPVAVAAAAQSYAPDKTVTPMVVTEPSVDRMKVVDDDEDDYDEEEVIENRSPPPHNISLPPNSSPIPSRTETPETPVVIRDFGVLQPLQQRKASSDDDSKITSSRARVSVHALLS